jgi:hypothetical protein
MHPRLAVRVVSKAKVQFGGVIAMQFQYRGAALNESERPSPDVESQFHIGFVMSTELGLQTQYLNWRRGLSEPDIIPEWIVVKDP